MGVKKNFPEIIPSVKFEPHLNWNPPRFKSNENLENEIMNWDQEFRERVNLNLNEDDMEENSSKMKTSMVVMKSGSKSRVRVPLFGFRSSPGYNLRVFIG